MTVNLDVWMHDGVLYEDHAYRPGPAAELPRHAHAEYQLSASFGFPGEYDYRGASHFVPVGSLTILHPGEGHLVRDPFHRDRAGRYLMMYIPVAVFEEVATAVSGRHRCEPFFRDPVVMDPPLVRLAVALHAASRDSEPGLQHDELRAELVAGLLERWGGIRDEPGRPRADIALARAYLEERRNQPVRLAELAAVARLSPHRLNRVFREHFGVPPHRYQLGLRIDRAKRLLAAGEGVAGVAAEVGFADQSHLTRHFRRLVGVTPGRIQRVGDKNVQDAP